MRRWWLLAALGVAVLLIGSGQEWVGGRVVDPVLGATTVSVPGTEAGSTLMAGALLAGAAVLAGLVGARPVQVVAGLCLLGAAALTGAPGLQAVSDPSGVVQEAASGLPAYAGASVVTTEAATGTIWPWLALAAAVLVALSGLALLVRALGPASRRHTSTTTAPAGATGSEAGATGSEAGATGSGATSSEAGSTGSKGEPTGSQVREPRTGAARQDAWDELTRGGDPTLDD